MESSRGDKNNKEDFQDIFEVINNRGSGCLIWREKNYSHQTNNDGIYVYQKAGLDYSS